MGIAKHTPGPWSTEKERVSLIGGNAPCINIFQLRGSVVARIYQVQQGEDEREANADLIAAAPELLALVKEFYSEMLMEYTDNLGIAPACIHNANFLLGKLGELP